MKWYPIFLCAFSLNSIMGMESDFLHQIPDLYVQKVKQRLKRGTGPKKMVNLVNHSCGGNLALKSYVLGKTWRKWYLFAVRSCPDPVKFFEEMADQAKQTDDQLAMEVSQIMQMPLTNPETNASLLGNAIELNLKRGLGFLIQLGEDLEPVHLSWSIKYNRPHLTTFLLKNRCPLSRSYMLLQDHPFVVAVQKRDARAVHLLLPHVKLTSTLKKYLNAQDLKYIEEIEDYIVK